MSKEFTTGEEKKIFWITELNPLLEFLNNLWGLGTEKE